MTVAVYQPQQNREDPLTKIAKGLSVASSILGIKNSIDQNELKKQEFSQQAEDRTAANARRQILEGRQDEAYTTEKQKQAFELAGGISNEKALDLSSKGFSFGLPGAKGAQQATIRTPQGDQVVSIVPPKPKGMTEFERQKLDLEKYKIAAAQTKDFEQQKKIINEGSRKLADAIEKTGVGDVISALEKLDKKVGIDADSDIPGVGLTGGLGSLTISEDGKNVRQLVKNVQNTLLKARSGGAISEGEAERLLDELGVGLTRSDKDLRRGLQMVRDTLRTKIELAESGAPEESVLEYRKRPGAIHSQRDLFLKKANELLEQELSGDQQNLDLQKQIDQEILQELQNRKNPRGGI